MTRGRRQQEKMRLDRKGYALSFASVFGFLLAFGFYAYLVWGSEGLDRTSLCPEGGPRGQYVLLVDRTDALTTPQREDLRNKLRGITEQVPRGHELSVFTVDEIHEQLLMPLMLRCSPGRDENLSGWSGNPELAKRRWEQDYAAPVGKVIDHVTEAEASAPRSPIMESIQSVTISSFGRGPKDVPRRLIIVSDMLQNTVAFSHYRKFPAFEQFRGTAYYRSVKSDLRGVTVTIVLLRREHVVPDRELIEFWQRYLADAGAVLDSVEAVQG